MMTSAAVLSFADIFATSIADFLAHRVDENVNIRARTASVSTSVANLVTRVRY